MSYLLLIGAVIFVCSASFIGGIFNKRTAEHPTANALYNMIYSGTALVGWTVLMLTDFSFDPAVLWYSLGFGITYAFAIIGSVGALKYGPVSLTALVSQLSLIGVTIYGFFFWNSPITLVVIAGLLSVAAALTLCIYRGDGKGGTNVKWLLFVSIGFLGNAGCTIIQKNQQMDFNFQHGKMMMTFAIACALIVCTCRYLLTRKKSPEPAMPVIKKGGILPLIAGVFNVVLNLFTILLAATELSPSLIYPTIAIGGILLSSLLSVIFLHERLQKRQWCGIAMGIVGILLLSL